MSNIDINVDRRTDGLMDGQKIGRLQAGAIKNDPEFRKTPFLQTVNINLIISLVTTSGTCNFDFTETSQ